MLMKRVLIVVTFLLFTTLMSACSLFSNHEPAEDREPVIFDVSMLCSADHPSADALRTFNDLLAKKTDGDYSLTFTFLEEADPEEILLQLQEANVDFVFLPNTALASCTYEFLLVEHPYLFESAEDFVAACNDPAVTTDLFQLILGDNVRILAEFYHGTHHLASANGVPDASAVACTVFDYKALAADLPVFTPTAHRYSAYAFAICEEMWITMPDDVHDFFRTELPKLAAEAAAEVVSLEETALADLEESGHLQADFDEAIFREALEEPSDLFLGRETSREIYEAILKHQND